MNEFRRDGDNTYPTSMIAAPSLPFNKDFCPGYGSHSNPRASARTCAPRATRSPAGARRRTCATGPAASPSWSGRAEWSPLKRRVVEPAWRCPSGRVRAECRATSYAGPHAGVLLQMSCDPDTIDAWGPASTSPSTSFRWLCRRGAAEPVRGEAAGGECDPGAFLDQASPIAKSSSVRSVARRVRVYGPLSGHAGDVSRRVDHELHQPHVLRLHYLRRYDRVRALGFCHQVHGSMGVVAEMLGV